MTYRSIHWVGFLVPVLVLLGCAEGSATNAGGVTPGEDAGTVFDPGSFDECGNGLDDDLDGLIDEDCFCARGEAQACFRGKTRERGVGACEDGVQTCDAAGIEFGRWRACEGDTLADVETCDGVDNNCDGAVDEGCPCTAGETSECGVEFVTEPCRGGTQTCDMNGTWSACDGAIGPSTEVCGDEVDNDCDGQQDEGCGCIAAPEVCEDGVDNDCDGDVDEDACGACVDAVEVCDGLDNDCDGEVDEGLSCAPVCTPVEEVCSDGEDNDCDGDVDEGCACASSVGPPRPIAPLSVARVTSQRPTLRWELAAGTDSARVELCIDRACSSRIATFVASGQTARPETNLPAGIVFWRLFGVASGSTGCDASPTWEFVVGPRSAPVDTSWGTLADMNGDGYADAVLDGSSGSSLLHLGGPSGLSSEPSATFAPPDGVYANSTNAGDVDGDGFTDVLVWGEDVASRIYGGVGTGTVTVRGLVYAGGVDVSTVESQSELTGPGDPNRAGWQSAAALGDMDRDGYGDVFAMVPGTAGRPSHIHIFRGSADGLASSPSVTITIGQADVGFGFDAVGAPGDVNGDGYADLSVPSRGIVTTYHGGPGGITDVVGTASVTNGMLRLRGVGDVNGDGYADLGVAGGENFEIFYGSPTGLSVVADASMPAPNFEGFGHVSTAGDVNGDGYADVVISRESISYTSGAMAYLGSAGGPTSAVRLLGPADMRFGLRVRSLGDVNGDGFGDLVIESFGRETCAAHIFKGGDAGASPDPSLTLSNLSLRCDPKSFSAAEAGGY